MIKIICKQKDGRTMEYLERPFKGSKIFKYKFDNITFFHAYDDIEEMAKYLEKNYNYETDYMIFRIKNNILKDVEIISGEKHEELNNYKDYFILFNGLKTVNDFIKLTDV